MLCTNTDTAESYLCLEMDMDKDKVLEDAKGSVYCMNLRDIFATDYGGVVVLYKQNILYLTLVKGEMEGKGEIVK